ncbi:MAG: hypothetical protein EOP07_12915 [Proteobacteria bacterium]|nr:MAG: hypothetical protein EOP07_12915 [Pseudomonadota bacterium]
MKVMTFLKAVFIAASLLSHSPLAMAVGPEESTCSSDAALACKTKNADVLAFRKQQISTLYAELVFPGPIEVLKDSANAAHLFEITGVKGRVTPVGKFTDFSGVVEYFYALAANPQNHVFETTIKSLLGDGDSVAVAVDLSFCKNDVADCSKLDLPTKRKNTLSEVGTFVFNRQNKIISFDLIIPNLGAAYDVPGKLNQAATIAGVCAFLTVGHIDPITQSQVEGGTCTTYFDAKEDFPPGFFMLGKSPFLNCVKFMSSLEYGSYDRANSNTFTCRQIHTLLTPLRPETHCPHVAYGGGGKCIDFTYESYYDEIKAGEDHDHH